MKRIIFQAINLLFTLAFVLSALVQFNDPDPAQWIVIYSLAALVCVLGFFRSSTVWAPALVGAGALIWAVLLLPAAVQSNLELSLAAVFGSAAMKNERVEVVREIGGLLIVSFWMAYLSFRSKKSPESNAGALAVKDRVDKSAHDSMPDRGPRSE